jgi:glycosyltransferase involved in cell wall biosynthesis
MQQTSFAIEIIIHDDASTDSTPDIIRENEFQNKEIIRPIYQKINQYSNDKVNIWSDILIPKVKGKYIALCDGDDYWIDPLKLQKQIDFLENNPDFSISYHNSYILSENGIFQGLVYSKKDKKVINISDLIKGEYAKMCTVVFRNLKNINHNSVRDDDTLSMEILRNGGLAHYQEDVMSVYQWHQGGVWSMKNAKDKYINSSINEEHIFKSFISNFPMECKSRRSNFFFSSSFQLCREGFYKESLNAIVQYIKYEKKKLLLLTNLLKYLKNLFKSIIKDYLRW